MSFTKAKLTRFNEVPTGSAPDCMYDPKDDAKLPGGIINKSKRFIDKVEVTPVKGSSKSETGSVKSCKSSQLFRTPSIRKQLKKFALNRVKPKTQTTPLANDDANITKEILWANRIEIQNKDETIADNHKVIEEQKEEISVLKKEIESLKREQEILKGDLELKHLEYEDKFKIEQFNVERIEQEKACLEKLIEELQYELLIQKKKHDDDLSNIEYIKEQHDMKVRELESCREVEKKQIICEYSDKLKELEQDLRNEIELVQELSLEKVKIAQLSCEEKCKAMTDDFNKDKLLWQIEFEKCQKIAETEIMQSEFEKLDLQANLNSIRTELESTKKVQQVLEKSVSDKYRESALLISRLNNLKDEFNQFKAKSAQTQDEHLKTCNELFKYELTVNTMRSTIDILSTRLQKSDADVEDLKEQVQVKDKMNIHYRTELALLQSKLIEYQVMLTNVTTSSRALLDNSDALAQRQEFLSIIEVLQQDAEGKISNVNKDLTSKIDLFKDLYKKYYDDTQQQLGELYATLKVIDKVLCNIEIKIRDKDNVLQERDEEILLLIDEIKELKLLKDENEYLKSDLSNADVLLKGKDVVIDNLERELSSIKYDFEDYKDGVNDKMQELEEVEAASAKREEELHNKIEEQRLRITDLEAQVDEAMCLIGPFREQLQSYEKEREAFETRTEQVRGDAREIALKYAELLGHQNHKQKLKYFVKIKKQNLDLTEDNFQLQMQIQKLKAEVDKLKVRSRDPSPNPYAKTKTTPIPKKASNNKIPQEDIENIGSPKFNKDLIKHNRVALGESPVRNDNNKKVLNGSLLLDC